MSNKKEVLDCIIRLKDLQKEFPSYKKEIQEIGRALTNLINRISVDRIPSKIMINLLATIDLFIINIERGRKEKVKECRESILKQAA